MVSLVGLALLWRRLAVWRPLSTGHRSGCLDDPALIQPEARRAFSEPALPYVKMEDFRSQEGRTAEE